MQRRFCARLIIVSSIVHKRPRTLMHCYYAIARIHARRNGRARCIILGSSLFLPLSSVRLRDETTGLLESMNANPSVLDERTRRAIFNLNAAKRRILNDERTKSNKSGTIIRHRAGSLIFLASRRSKARKNRIARTRSVNLYFRYRGAMCE